MKVFTLIKHNYKPDEKSRYEALSGVWSWFVAFSSPKISKFKLLSVLPLQTLQSMYSKGCWNSKHISIFILLSKRNKNKIMLWIFVPFPFIFFNNQLTSYTLESGIDVGQGISVWPGKFVKNNKCRALNKRRASDF